MAGINSRAKGNRGERVAAEVFQKWTGKTFSKVPRSGGLHWKTANSIGDIICTTEGHYFPFAIEVKNHKEIDFAQLLIPDLKGVKILEFWEQCSRDAERGKKIPLLLMRYDRLPKEFFFVVMTQEMAKLFHTELALTNSDLKSLRFHDYKTDQPLMILQSTQFFKTDYKTIKAIAKTHLKKLKNAKTKN